MCDVQDYYEEVLSLRKKIKDYENVCSEAHDKLVTKSLKAYRDIVENDFGEPDTALLWAIERVVSDYINEDKQVRQKFNRPDRFY